ncbi:hypothetical protein CHLRE_03g168500v5 [Chlamydomonas reinhardtii]|uniref:Uncharacterized protein n=1 Tax=Chlamydomonas reinhardtii TaxID=3055 RepID=A0A2K3DWW6_CHLRE|nr:uncharacterized protein CHLRE_03g168500v5 [Chlamydomonas reinhardtii]PNW85025.1 hypothetical protein CHLRE_03g168500v5 [Chlamydomonas reinhardtii]
MSGKSKSREMLEVPAVDPMERKLANLTRERPSIGPAPRSAMLEQLAAFLPQMAKENQKLQQELQSRPAAEFDIEAVDEEAEGPYIEMDLACGVLELRDAAALAAAERAMQGQGGLELGEGGAAEASSSSSDDDSDDDSDEDSDEDSEDASEGQAAAQAAAAVAGRHHSKAAGAKAGGGGRRGGGGGVEVQEASESEPMDCEDEEGQGQGQDESGPGAAAGPGRPGRGGPARGGLVGGRRRKVAAKRSKMIEEL